MAIPIKTLACINNRFLNYFYNVPEDFKRQTYIWERRASVPIFMIYKPYFIHKGMYWRRARLTPTNISVPIGTYTLTRKPLAHPLKRAKKGRKR